MDQAVCCYRHPDRETGVRCARCERPICPDCMVSASVGFQCPDCLRGERRSVPARPRTLAGGTLTANPRLVTIVLIALNAAVFLAAQGNARLVDRLQLIGLAYDPALHQAVGVADHQWYRLLTAVFLHQAVAHIGLNMLSLWWIGPPVEQALGRIRYVTLYLLAGLGGSALSFTLSASNQPSLGASGAIFGLLGALFVLTRRVKADMRPVLIVIALNLVFSFTISDIDWRAHIGGLVTGTLVAYGMVHAPRRRRALVQWGTCAVVLVAIVVLVMVRTANLTG